MKKIFSTAVIFVVLIYVLSISSTHTATPEIANKYRRMITVDNTRNPNALTNYQVFFNVTYDSDMQPDFDDLRFTWYDETSSEEVNIDYWLDKFVDSEYALVWVEVPSIRGLGQEVLYMYYGDPDAVSESNGEETFVFFDDFSTDTTANYEILNLSDTIGTAEIMWDPNGWLLLNASSCNNQRVRLTESLIDATEEKYWLETRAKGFAGDNDHFGVMQIYKHNSDIKWYYSLLCLVREVHQIASIWGCPTCWEFWETGHGTVPLEDRGKNVWRRFGVGTSANGTVVGGFYDDDYNKIETITEHTIHQDSKWWIILAGGKVDVYFDYVRVRKFTDPQPTCSIGGEELLATVNIDPDTLNLKSNGEWITAYIVLPKGYNVEDIVLETVCIDGIPAAWSEIQDGVYMAKFDRALVRDTLTGSIDYAEGDKFHDLELTVAGELVDGTPFEGSDTIRVIGK